jgi:hypothetical protein
MSCGGGHLGFPIGIKNSIFEENFQLTLLGRLACMERV